LFYIRSLTPLQAAGNALAVQFNPQEIVFLSLWGRSLRGIQNRHNGGIRIVVLSPQE
jgi:hypothetical protein